MNPEQPPNTHKYKLTVFFGVETGERRTENLDEVTGTAHVLVQVLEVGVDVIRIPAIRHE